MQTSPFQIRFVAGFALVVGLFLSPSAALGYPAGAAVSVGSNPIWSAGGTMDGGTHTVVTADSGDLVITDVSLSSSFGSWWYLTLSRSDGQIVGQFAGESLQNYPLHRTFSSGIRIPQGQTLTLVWDAYYGGHSNYRYTLSGYYAQP